MYRSYTEEGRSEGVSTGHIQKQEGGEVVNIQVVRIRKVGVNLQATRNSIGDSMCRKGREGIKGKKLKPCVIPTERFGQ